MNFSAAFTELIILSNLVWNFLLQLSLLSDFQPSPLWCLIPCSYSKCSSFTKFTKPQNTFPAAHLSSLNFKSHSFISLFLPPSRVFQGQMTSGPGSASAVKSVLFLIYASSAHWPQLSLETTLKSFARDCKSWKVKSVGDLLPLHWTQNMF